MNFECESCSFELLEVGDFGKSERAWRVTGESLVVLAEIEREGLENH